MKIMGERFKCPEPGCPKDYSHRQGMNRHRLEKHGRIHKKTYNKIMFSKMTKSDANDLIEKYVSDEEIADHLGCSNKTWATKRTEFELIPGPSRGKSYYCYVMEPKGLSKHSHILVMKPGKAEVDSTNGLQMRRSAIIRKFLNYDGEIITIDLDTIRSVIALDWWGAKWFEQQFKTLSNNHITCYKAVQTELFVYDQAIIDSIIADGVKLGYLIDKTLYEIVHEWKAGQLTEGYKY
jgi:hypothetical protein